MSQHPPPDESPAAFGAVLSALLGDTGLVGAATRSPANHPLAVDLVSTRPGDICVTQTIPPQEAFHVVLQLHDMASHDLWLDGHLLRTEPYPRRSLSIIDLSRSPHTRIAVAHQALVFYLPRGGVSEIAEEFGTAPIDSLRLPPGTPAIDPVMARIGAALLPHLHTGAPDTLLVDHMLLVMQAHMATAYGTSARRPPVPKGGLASWQERRAKEVMADAVGRSVTLAEVAAAVGLSAAHFARSFRRSTGLTPHDWLMQRRMETARAMLLATHMSVAEVASAVGYAEQSSFSKAFARATGLPPASWARLHRGS